MLRKAKEKDTLSHTFSHTHLQLYRARTQVRNCLDGLLSAVAEDAAADAAAAAAAAREKRTSFLIDAVIQDVNALQHQLNDAAAKAKTKAAADAEQSSLVHMVSVCHYFCDVMFNVLS
jgi:hypothetical protein